MPISTTPDPFARELQRLLASGQDESVVAPVSSDPVRIVQDLLERAVNAGVSDLHFEPQAQALLVRFRLDGALQVVQTIPQRFKAEVLSRLKVMASMDISEKRRPQDGRIHFAHLGQKIDVRVSSLPTEHGEKLVLRILDQSAVDLDLAKLGLDAKRREVFEQVFRQPYGMLLITGPTGAGKSTTLYSVLNALRSPQLNITTVEDPVEYRLEGIVQTAVKPEIGLTFANALRTILRQDPNVIMVGEARDHETAQIAIRAALTGHLVLTTLHTNDAPSAVTRLVDMGIEPFLVSSAVNLILAQRLVRKVCSDCAVPDDRARAILTGLGEDPAGQWLRGRGCARCGMSGHRGRVGIYEMMVLSEELRVLISQGADANRLREQALREGMVTLRQDALSKASQGLICLDEVVRETCS